MRAHLQDRIEAAATTPPNQQLPSDVETLIGELLAALERGEVRAAEKQADGAWSAVPWVKRGILLGFRAGHLVGSGGASLSFVDKHTYPIRRFSPRENIRIVPGGSSVRRGAYVAPSVVCMPPMYINVGA
jgi:2,3,4,5-tetrahydropyridine-2-carboxylate N-succinyltransferase